MKKYILSIFVLILLIASCRKEQVVLEEPVVTTEAPTAIEGAFYSGQITDVDGEAVVTNIRLYQEEVFIGEVSSDENGFYSTKSILLREDLELTFAIEDEGYFNKYRRKKITTSSNENFDFQLAKKQSIFGTEDFHENPGSNDLVKVYGTLTDYEDKPIKNAFCLVMYDIELQSSISFIGKGFYDFADENGYVEFLVPNDEVLYFHSIVNSETNASYECFPIINQQDTVFLEAFFMDELGILTEDTEIIEQENLKFVESNYLIYGNFQNCDGTPVTSGEVTIQIRYPYRDWYVSNTFTTDQFDSNGQFEFNFSLCYHGEVEVELRAINQDSYGITLDFTCTPNGLHLAPIQACDNFTVLKSYLNLTIANQYTADSIRFSHAVPENPFTFNDLGLHQIGFVSFSMEDIMLGDNVINNLSVINIGIPPFPSAFTANNGELSANVSSIINGEIIGTISGNVEVEQLGIQPITGDFIINYE